MSPPSESEIRVEPIFDSALRPQRAWWVGALADTLLLLVPLALANVFLARDDPGFLNLNPSPWILLPLVLGARCGLLAGQGGAVLAAVAVLLGFRLVDGAPQFTAVITGEAWFFVSLLVAGATGGLIHALLTSPTQAARAKAAQLARSEQRMRHDLELLRESENELSRRLLLHGAEFISLQDRIRNLLASPIESLDRGLLDLFQEMFAITRASIYQRDPGDDWRLRSCLGDRDTFSDRCHFKESENPLAAAAIRSNDIATCTSVLQDEANALAIIEPVGLVAIPWRDTAIDGEHSQRLLIVDQMSFANANWEVFSRMQALFLWMSTVAATAPRPTPDQELPEMLSPEQFDAQLSRVLDCSEQLRLGYRLVLFERTPDGDTASQNAFVRSIRGLRQAGDTLGGVLIGEDRSNKKPQFVIALIIPVDSDIAAENRIAQILKPLANAAAVIRYRVLTIGGQREEFLAQWQSLLGRTGSTSTSTPAPDTVPPPATPSSVASDLVPPNPVQPA